MKILILALTLIALVTGCSSSSPTTANSGGVGGTVASSAGTGTLSAGTGGASAGSPSGGAGMGGTSAGAAGMTAAAGAGGGSTCAKCPATCCDRGAICVDDGLGNLACKKSCTSNNQCPTSAPCCQVLKDGFGACEGDSGGSMLCRCTTGAECTSKSCAPGQDTMGNPVGPYICVPNDGGPYNGCNGIGTSCGSGYCCFTDAKGNEFCATECTNNSQCGAAACVTYNNANTTCGGMLGCGPK